MKARSRKSMELYGYMLEIGYPEEFCDIITKNLNTDFTAVWMMRYLANFKKILPLEEVADEMLGILSERNRMIEKKKNQHANAVYNRYLRYGFEIEE